MIQGLHHITAITGNIRKSIRFYTEILGLSLVKRTINFDNPNIWHFYFGNQTGSSGTIITFFYQPGLPRGQAGVGSTKVTGFSVSETSLEFWRKRLREYQVEFRGPFSRFGEEYLVLFDFDGLELELVASAADDRQGESTPGISAANCIKGLHHVEVTCSNAQKTNAYFMNSLGHTMFKEENGRFRLYSGSAMPGNFVDIVSRPTLPLHRSGIGTVHHIALATENHDTLKQLREKISKSCNQISVIHDRHYFKSIYFKDASGLKLEIATLDPGFLKDEPIEKLGQNLMLPPWLEADREKIAEVLPSID